HVELQSNLIQFRQVIAFMFDPHFLNQPQIRRAITQFQMDQFSVQNLGQITVQINNQSLSWHPLLAISSLHPLFYQFTNERRIVPVFLDRASSQERVQKHTAHKDIV
ncbi:hypothetical protein N9H39_09340, partial [Gammaproteobacteria bacterium]|nr:hypothetical protein [Gammaproteobacteria bacterium]